jgi:signal transduction histidine kinase
MHETKLTKVTTDLARRILDLSESNRDLALGLARHEVVNRELEVEGKKAGLLLQESRHLQKHLQEITRKILTVKEEGRKKMSLRLQDEIVQTLEGIHLRLLVLNKEVTANNEGFQNEIANTQKLVRQSVEVINSYARECGIEHEN